MPDTALGWSEVGNGLAALPVAVFGNLVEAARGLAADVARAAPPRRGLLAVAELALALAAFELWWLLRRAVTRRPQSALAVLPRALGQHLPSLWPAAAVLVAGGVVGTAPASLVLLLALLLTLADDALVRRAPSGRGSTASCAGS